MITEENKLLFAEMVFKEMMRDLFYPLDWGVVESRTIYKKQMRLLLIKCVDVAFEKLENVK